MIDLKDRDDRLKKEYYDTISKETDSEINTSYKPYTRKKEQMDNYRDEIRELKSKLHDNESQQDKIDKLLKKRNKSNTISNADADADRNMLEFKIGQLEQKNQELESNLNAKEKELHKLYPKWTLPYSDATKVTKWPKIGGRKRRHTKRAAKSKKRVRRSRRTLYHRK
jgi:chromosome segregation ATPase